MNANERKLDFERFREILRQIGVILSASEDWYFANLISDALNSSDLVLAQFLTSNELWGGSGSIADSALSRKARDDQRREFERLMIQLGRLQIDASLMNVRTGMWTGAFSGWDRDNV